MRKEKRSWKSFIESFVARVTKSPADELIELVEREKDDGFESFILISLDERRKRLGFDVVPMMPAAQIVALLRLFVERITSKMVTDRLGSLGSRLDDEQDSAEEIEL